MRTLERLFRRAGLPLGMSEGFHPKPRMTFPLALSVGIAGWDELMEVELSQPWGAEQVLSALTAQRVPGLEFVSVVELPPGAKKPQAARVTCELPLPVELCAGLAERAQQTLAADTLPVLRQDRTLDVRPYIEALELEGPLLRMRLKVTPQGTVRPREVLAALGLDDLDQLVFQLVRTKVELAEDIPAAAANAGRPTTQESETS